jgi:hypothetical protein
MNTRTRWSGVKITSVSAITSPAKPQRAATKITYVKRKLAKLSRTFGRKTAQSPADLPHWPAGGRQARQPLPHTRNRGRRLDGDYRTAA